MKNIKLPEPRREGTVSVESVLQRRRSVREYQPDPLNLAEVAQLLWAGQGITAPEGWRTAPSAGATYPLDTYLVAGRVTGLEAGVYRYLPGAHELVPVAAGDVRGRLATAALDQGFIREAAVSLVYAAVVGRTAQKYGARAEVYVHMEAGHAAQNVALQAVALGIDTVMVGAFEAGSVAEMLRLAPDQAVEYCVVAGRRR